MPAWRSRLGSIMLMIELSWETWRDIIAALYTQGRPDMVAHANLLEAWLEKHAPGQPGRWTCPGCGPTRPIRGVGSIGEDAATRTPCASIRIGCAPARRRVLMPI